MARLYADEQFPRLVSELFRTIGHDVLTVQEAGNDNLDIPDEDVLYHVRLITCNLIHLCRNCKTLSPAPLPPCGLNDKSFTGHDISLCH
jgi:hypothetical protein